MTKVMFAVLAVLGLSLATGALASAAHAEAYVNPPTQNGGSNS